MALFANRLTLSAVGPVIGRQGRAAEYCFGAFLAIVVMVAVQAVGVLLVTALLVAPAASGRLLAASFKGMFWASAILGVLAGQIGLWASFQPAVNASVGASVVLGNVFFFGLALAGRKIFRRGGK